jgi:hypothetical protein
VELISVVQVLRRRRALVAAGVLVALAAGLLAAGRLPIGPAAVPAHATAVAETRLFVDTPHPLAIDLGADAQTIGAHAALLADLMAAEGRAREIAREAGVAAEDLAVLRPALTAPPEPGQLGERTAAAPPGRPYTLKVTASVALPIVSLEASARDGRVAARIAEAGTKALESIASDKGPTPARRLVVEQLEPVTVTEVVAGGGRGPLLGPGVAIVTFVLWCTGVVIASGLTRAWNRPVPAPRTAG